MVNDWIETTLGDISTDVSYGYTESADTEKVGPRFLRITDIQNGVVDWNTVPYCPIDDSKLKKYLLEEGDIVVARTGNSTGENYIFTGEEDTVFASYLIRFKIDRSIANPFYVWYSMRSPNWWTFVNSSKTGSAQAGANAKVLGLYPLDLPSLDTQKAIAHILGSLDDKIELNRQMNETLEAMAQALFKSWFVDFDPVIDNALAAGNAIPDELLERAELRKGVEKKDSSDIQALFPDEFEFTEEMGWIPKGWGTSTLDDLTTELRRGISPKYTEVDGVRVINQRCIRNHSIDYSVCRLNDASLRKVEGRYLEVGDVLVNSTGVGTLGRMAQVLYLNEPAVVDSHVTVVRPNAELVKPYMFGRLMLSIEPLVESMGLGSTGQTELSRVHLGELVVCVPPIELQEFVEKLFLSYSDKSAFNIQQNITLSKLRDTLLPKLMSGDLHISDAVALVDEAV